LSTDAAVPPESASVKPDELPRRLGVASTAMLLVGITIGSGILLSTGIILLGIPVYFAWQALRNRRTLAVATATADSADR
jgi:hypothetical protein